MTKTLALLYRTNWATFQCNFWLPGKKKHKYKICIHHSGAIGEDLSNSSWCQSNVGSRNYVLCLWSAKQIQHIWVEFPIQLKATHTHGYKEFVMSCWQAWFLFQVHKYSAEIRIKRHFICFFICPVLLIYKQQCATIMKDAFSVSHITTYPLVRSIQHQSGKYDLECTNQYNPCGFVVLKSSAIARTIHCSNVSDIGRKTEFTLMTSGFRILKNFPQMRSCI